jgi:D-serine deaminase-like pyridoxal phosphate-dependent protein
MPDSGWDYDALKALVRGERLPLMVVDLDVLDANVRRLGRIAEEHGKRLRTASKSVRVPDLLRHIVDVGGPSFQGVMCFAVDEARLLHSLGFDDLLIAYPTVQPSDLDIAWALTQQGATLTLMLDAPAHADMLARYWRERSQQQTSTRPLRVCIDHDMSWRPMGLHIGAQRSPVRSVGAMARVVDAITAHPELCLAGVMGYEAQIAGLGDETPFAPLLNPAKKFIKRRSVQDVAAKRRAAMEMLHARGIRLAFFNGGGTGSLRTTSAEPWVTEVTAGSGFLQSHLFDYYASNENQPAFCFALQVTRSSQPDHVTCQSGGFIASGPTGADKAPVPFLPRGLKATGGEGFGEVQTPLLVPPALRGRLQPGDPVFFRPAKAGEIAERFNEYLLKRGDRIVGRAKTYRGMGHCFF